MVNAKRTGYILLIIALVFLFTEYALRISDSAIIPELATTFNTNARGIGVLSSFYYIPYVIMQIPAGLLLDRFGLKKSLFSAMLAVAAGAILMGSSHHFALAIIARIFMGIGSAFAFISSIKILQTYFNMRFITLWIGIAMTIATLGAVCGQEPWLLVTRLLGKWQYTYYLTGLFILIFSICLAKYPADFSTKKTTINIKQIKNNLQRIFLRKNTWIILIYVGLLSTPMTVFAALWGIPFFTQGWHLSRDLATSLMTASWFGGLIGGLILGYIADYFGSKQRILCIVGLLAATLLTIIIFVHLSWGIYLTLLFVLGLLCNGNVIVFSIISTDAPRATVGLVTGLTNTFNMGGGPIFQILIGVLLARHTVHTRASFPHYNLHTYQHALIILPILLTIFSIGTLFYGNDKKQAN